MLLKNCKYLVTQNAKRQVLRNADVLIEGNEIIKIGKKLKGEDRIDCSEKIVMPGLVNTHTHLGMHPLKGMCDDEELFEWLRKMERHEAKFTKKDVYNSTLDGIRESIRSGTTTIYDSYKFPQERLEAFRKTGVRGVISATVKDEKGLLESKKFLSHFSDKKIRPAIAANALYNCDGEILRKISEYSNEKNIIRRIHVGETRKERHDVLKKTGKLVIDYLDSVGFLGEKALLVHCIWITKGEIKKLAKTNTKVSHTPISNMKLASGGVMPLSEMLAEKVCVGLGTDSAASNNNLDMFEEMKMCALLHRHHKWNPKIITPQAALDMATIRGAQALGMESETGSIEEGKKADVIALSMDENIRPVNDVISTIVFSANGMNTSDVIIDGKLLLCGKSFVR